MERISQARVSVAPNIASSTGRGTEASIGTANVRDVLEALYDTVLVTDLEGFILESNGRAERHLGFCRAELLGRPIGQMIEEISSDVVSNLRKNLERGRFTVLEAYCSKKDRSGFLAEIAVGSLGYNGAARMMFTLRNIESRRETQELLRAEHNALENSASGIAMTDLSARIVRGNAAFLKLWEFPSLKEAEGMDLRDLWQGIPVPMDLIRRPLSGRSWIGEVAACTRKGRSFFVQVTAAPTRDSDNRISWIVYSFLDVTARRKAEMALRREAEAQIARARQSNEFSGLLTAVTIPDLIQLIDSTKKTGTLVILGEADRTVGSVGFLDGQVQRASCGDQSGESAFFILLQVGGQGFRFEAKTEAERDLSIQRTTLGLLLEGVRLADEANPVPEGDSMDASDAGGSSPSETYREM